MIHIQKGLAKKKLNNGLWGCQQTRKSRPLFKVRCVNSGKLPDFHILADSAAPQLILDLALMEYVTLNKILLYPR